MILSVSRRTDIPSFYSEWFMHRIKEGYVYIRNPMNAKQISRANIKPDVVDCIVFWSKNPAPMLKYLDELDRMGYRYYFQFTLTPYDTSIEQNLPAKAEIEDIFIKLSARLGKERVVWRYDPILLNGEWTIDRHESFRSMAHRLAEFTDEFIISFIDPYKKTVRQMGEKLDRRITTQEMTEIAQRLAEVGRETGLAINTCAEAIDLDVFGIGHASCIDRKRIEKIIGCCLNENVKKDSQRPHCGCIECIDIGAYSTCKNGCLYCYANFSREMIERNCSLHNPKSALLVGDSNLVEKVAERKVTSLKDEQLRLL